MKIKLIFSTVLFLVFCGTNLKADKKVEVTGSAPADRTTAREQALSDALSKAVQQGVGVDLRSETKTSDFTLDYYRVFTSAFGHIKSYKILGAKVDSKNNEYFVKIEATVAKGAPGLNDKLALQQLVRLKGSPKILIRTQENIKNIDSSVASLVNAALREKSTELGLRVVDDYNNSSGKKFDFLILAKVNGKYLGSRKIYDIEKYSFILDVEIEALQPDTGEIIAHVNYPGIRVASTFVKPDLAFRDCLEQILNGNSTNQQKSLNTIFQRIFLKWTVELDLGHEIQVQIENADISSLNKLISKLQDTKNITNAWIKSFQADGTSFIEVETRLSPPALGEEVIIKMSGNYRIKEYSGNTIKLEKTYHYIYWGLGIVGSIVLIILILRKKGNNG